VRVAEAVAAKGDPARHKCFVSYHVDDADEVTDFIEDFGDVFIPRVIGVSEEDDFIDSDDTDYVMDRIREEYLRDSTVTIVMIGKCTWSRRFVDWEVYSSLRNDSKNRRNGLMAITLPSVANDDDRRLPARVSDNVDGDKLYARWWKYPSYEASLKNYIKEAFDARTTKDHLIDNTRDRRMRNASC
jgi:hypothetical protein